MNARAWHDDLLRGGPVIRAALPAAILVAWGGRAGRPPAPSDLTTEQQAELLEWYYGTLVKTWRDYETRWHRFATWLLTREARAADPGEPDEIEFSVTANVMKAT